MKTITVTINKGRATIATSGFTGGECKRRTQALKDDLGVVTGEAPTAEAYEIEQTVEQEARQ